jgi:pimeloyl-ACP methyl ester carboxylesterase
MDPETSCTLPVVLVPGLGLGRESWSPTVRALHRSGTLDRGLVRTVLLPGYGRPGRNRAGMSPRVLARAVVAELGHGAPALLVGLSAGCQVVAHVALQAPDRVAGLVLVGPTTDPRANNWPRLVRRWVATARSEPIRQLPALIRQYRRTGLVNMVRAMDAARRDRVEHVLPLLTCPTLLLRGAHDRIAPEDWVRSLTERVPDRAGDGSVLRRWVTLAAGAHMVPFTHGDLVARAVRDFLADLDDRRTEPGSGG